MIRLSYLSSSRHDLAPAELEAILSVARRRNSADQITGMLMYHERSFLQVLEGPEDKVRACFERIQRDRRHFGLYAMQQSAATTRAFSNWSMGLANIETLPHFPPDTVRSLADIASRLQDVSGMNVRPSKLGVAETMLRFLRRFDLVGGRTVTP